MSTETDLSERIARLEARETIRDVLNLYCRGLDRLDGSILAGVFWDDAEVDYGPGLYRGAAGAFVPFALEFQGAMAVTQHRLSNVIIELHGDRAFTESYMYAYHVMEQDGRQVDLIVGGRFFDEFERRNREWRIAKRTEAIDWAHERTSTEDWFDRQPPLNRGAHDQSDAFYRLRKSFLEGLHDE